MRVKRLKELHKAVIHDRKGTDREYYEETKQIARLNDKEAYKVCKKCFPAREKVNG